MHYKVHYNINLKPLTLLLHSNLRPKLSHLPLNASWFYTLWWFHWSILAAATSVYSPQRLQATTYSTHAGINLLEPQSATPSRVPQYELQSAFVPRQPNLSDNTKEGNLPELIRTSHDLTHSTGLPKPRGYNLEWPRVTPIQVALIIGPNKASCQDLHPNLYGILLVV